MSAKMLEKMSEKVFGKMPEKMPEKGFGIMLDKMSGKFFEKISEKRFGKISNKFEIFPDNPQFAFMEMHRKIFFAVIVTDNTR